MRTLMQGPYSVRYKGVDYIGVSIIVGCPQGESWWYTIVPASKRNQMKLYFLSRSHPLLRMCFAF